MTWTAAQKKAQSKKLKAAWAERKNKKAETEFMDGARERFMEYVTSPTPEVLSPEWADPEWDEPDMVNHPPHYEHGPIECIDYIEGILTPQEYVGYLRGCMIKYQHRLVHKGSASENAEKINWYGARLAAKLKELENAN